ncbi:MAG: stage III sporulation protein AB [Clostridia bacterium]|nr:stage III sporulation protein AB [Clostridia bacterium]
MKVVLLIVVVILFSYIGYGLSAYYSNRTKFFKNLELLFDKLTHEINFSQGKLADIIKGFDCHNKDVQRLSKNFLDCLEFDLEVKSEKIFEGIKILNDDEKDVIILFLKSLGKFDAYNQTQQLQSQRKQINNFFQSAEEQQKKYAPLYLKLGIIAGLTFALVFA